MITKEQKKYFTNLVSIINETCNDVTMQYYPLFQLRAILTLKLKNSDIQKQHKDMLLTSTVCRMIWENYQQNGGFSVKHLLKLLDNAE